jgi:hypothetical protein
MKDMVVLFSGGRTSGYMAWWLIQNKSDEYNFHFVFANTGLEHEKTLDFVNECDSRMGLNLTWIETVINPEIGKGSEYRLTNYKSAIRDRSLFEDMIKAYGIPNSDYIHCNRELKTNPVKSWQREHKLRKAKVAIGYRTDETDRINPDNKNGQNFVYPLAFWHPTTKEQIRHWWDGQEFDLDLPEHLGNCKTCWKKSDRKLFTIAKHFPEYFDDFKYFESKYREAGRGDQKRVFFREYKTAEDILSLAENFPEHKEFKDTMPELQLDIFGHIDPIDVAGGGCGNSSCEPYMD